MLQPHRKNRRFFLVACSFGASVFLLAALIRFHFHGELRWAEAPLETGEFALTQLLMLAASGGFAWLVAGLIRGPSLHGQRHIGSEEWGQCFGAAMAALLFDALALRGFAMLRDGSYDSYAITVAALVVFVPLGIFFTAGVVFTLWGLARRGRSRVILPDHPLIAGDSFECTLEIPFSVERAPAVRAVLSLVASRLESPLNDISADETSHWSQAVEAHEWRPSGPRYSATRFEFELPKGVPHDFGRIGTHYSWLLEVDSTTPGQRFSGRYLLPIAFQDPFAEGLLASA